MLLFYAYYAQNVQKMPFKSLLDSKLNIKIAAFLYFNNTFWPFVALANQFLHFLIHRRNCYISNSGGG